MELTYILVGAVVVVIAAIFLFGGSRGDTKVVLGASGGKAEAAPQTGRFDDLMRDAQALLAEGRKAEAIKLLNERSGIPLDNAASLVEGLEKLGAAGTTTFTVTTNTMTLSADDSAEIQRLIRQGEKIEAIKLIRERTGLGLEEAKDIADQLG